MTGLPLDVTANAPGTIDRNLSASTISTTTLNFTPTGRSAAGRAVGRPDCRHTGTDDISPMLPTGILEPGTGSSGDGVVAVAVVAAIAPGKTRLLKVSDVGISLVGFIFADLGRGNDRLPEPGCIAIGTINSDGNAVAIGVAIGVAKLVFTIGLGLRVGVTSGRLKVSSWGELVVELLVAEVVIVAKPTGILTAGGKLLTTGRKATGAVLIAIGVAIGLAIGTAICRGGTDRITGTDDWIGDWAIASIALTSKRPDVLLY